MSLTVDASAYVSGGAEVFGKVVAPTFSAEHVKAGSMSTAAFKSPKTTVDHAVTIEGGATVVNDTSTMHAMGTCNITGTLLAKGDTTVHGLVTSPFACQQLTLNAWQLRANGQPKIQMTATSFITNTMQQVGTLACDQTLSCASGNLGALTVTGLLTCTTLHG